VPEGQQDAEPDGAGPEDDDLVLRLRVGLVDGPAGHRERFGQHRDGPRDVVGDHHEALARHRSAHSEQLAEGTLRSASADDRVRDRRGVDHDVVDDLANIGR
jgi:hypothetical protein